MGNMVRLSDFMHAVYSSQVAWQGSGGNEKFFFDNENVSVCMLPIQILPVFLSLNFLSARVCSTLLVGISITLEGEEV